jgi:NhaP-type Na+/H+ or K+/H+ antiporter
LHSFMPDIHTRREALFCGWFGPMGIGALPALI